jgi:hypothetical protein
MRNRLMLALLGAIALGGCTLFGGSREIQGEAGMRRTTPLVIPPTFALPPPGQAAAPAPAKSS